MNAPIPLSMLRRRVARRSPLLSSLMLLMSACPGSESAWTPPPEATGQRVELYATEPRNDRHLLLRVVPSEGKKVNLQRISLNLEVMTSWHDLTGGPEEIQPWLLIRLVDDRDGRLIAEQATVADKARSFADKLLLGGYDNTICEQTDRCETTLRLELERQGPPAGGIVSVDWRAKLFMDVSDNGEADVEVTLSEL